MHGISALVRETPEGSLQLCHMRLQLEGTDCEPERGGAHQSPNLPASPSQPSQSPKLREIDCVVYKLLIAEFLRYFVIATRVD